MARGRPSTRAQIWATGTRMIAGQLEVRYDGRRSLHEQLDRRTAGDGLEGRVLRIRKRQRRHAILVLAGQVEHGATRDEDLQQRRRLEHSRQRESRIHHVLEVVEKQQRPLPQRELQRLHQNVEQAVCHLYGGHRSARQSIGSPSRHRQPRRARRSRRLRESRRDTRAATSSPSRVLPLPPGPVSVTRRTSGRESNSVTAASSRSRPRSGIAGTGSEPAPAGRGCGTSSTHGAPGPLRPRLGQSELRNVVAFGEFEDDRDPHAPHLRSTPAASTGGGGPRRARWCPHAGRRQAPARRPRRRSNIPSAGRNAPPPPLSTTCSTNLRSIGALAKALLAPIRASWSTTQSTGTRPRPSGRSRRLGRISFIHSDFPPATRSIARRESSGHARRRMRSR